MDQTLEPETTHRMFRWKGIFLVAESYSAAWDLILMLVEDSDEDDVQAWERDTRYFTGSALYDGVGPREYLHAVDPEEILEILDDDIPSGLVEVVSDKFAMGTPGVVIHQQARLWAENLPLGGDVRA